LQLRRALALAVRNDMTDNRLPTKRLPQRRHLVVKHLLRRRRRRLPPQLVNQPIARDRLVRPEDQQGQQGTPPARSNRERDPAIADDLEWAQQAEVQTSKT
jgi:hypothetical protein